jgi:hypothetical protein
MSIEIRENKGRVEAHLYRKSDEALFQQIADAIISRFGGKWTKQLEGFDQKYWDLQIGGVVLTLHLEIYTGIYLFPHHDTKNVEAANSLVIYIASFIDDEIEDLQESD